ncbi:hypothetical protein [Vibrio fluvialis]|uniref:hypothetical protein n=1 Tax=Vibrio fluvialis TaxID=676 RepID=UPI001ED8CAA9|nr:hypothetical protein [Vibrio fluvialis]
MAQNAPKPFVSRLILPFEHSYLLRRSSPCVAATALKTRSLIDIELTQRESGKFGRPKRTTVGTDDFLAKHSDIVTSLERGRSINQTAEFTGKGRSTVKRVKAAMNK